MRTLALPDDGDATTFHLGCLHLDRQAGVPVNVCVCHHNCLCGPTWDCSEIIIVWHHTKSTTLRRVVPHGLHLVFMAHIHRYTTTLHHTPPPVCMTKHCVFDAHVIYTCALVTPMAAHEVPHHAPPDENKALSPPFEKFIANSHTILAQLHHRKHHITRH